MTRTSHNNQRGYRYSSSRLVYEYRYSYRTQDSLTHRVIYIITVHRG
jgi:hypothetical protein